MVMAVVDIPEWRADVYSVGPANSEGQGAAFSEAPEPTSAERRALLTNLGRAGPPFLARCVSYIIPPLCHRSTSCSLECDPKSDWRIEQLKAIADRYEISYRQPGTNHVTFRPRRGDKLTIPARRPVKPVYVRKFLAMLDALEAEDEPRA